jgi:hypothetical protein
MQRFCCVQRFFYSSPPPWPVLAPSISIHIHYLKGELDGSRSPRAQNLPKQQAGFIGVPEYLAGKIQEACGIKKESLSWIGLMLNEGSQVLHSTAMRYANNDWQERI